MGPATAMDTFQTLSVHSRRHVSMHSAFQSSTGAKEIHTWHETTMPGSHKTTTATAAHGHQQRHRGSTRELYLGHLAEVGKALSTTEGPASEGVQGSEGTCKQHRERQSHGALRSTPRGASPRVASQFPTAPEHSQGGHICLWGGDSGAGSQPGAPPAPPGPLWLVVGAAQPDSLRPRELGALSPVAGLPASIVHTHGRSDKPPMEGQTGPGVCPSGPGRGSEREGTAAHTAHVGTSSVDRDFC